MNHRTQIRCYFPGFRAECSCGWVGDHFHATRRGAEYPAETHRREHALKIRMATYDGSIPAAEPTFSDTILFGGVPFIIEHKDGSNIPPEVAERQRLVYQQIIDREA